MAKLSPFQLIVTRNGVSKGKILSGGKPISFSRTLKPINKQSKKSLNEVLGLENNESKEKNKVKK